MLAVAEGGASLIGAIMIGNPSGVVDHFCPDDVKLLETLANNTSVALENDRLGQTVWRLKELQRELQHQASHDPLTDLANRSLFVQRVGEALRASAGRVSVIFIDIDDFKTVNDSLGHAAGDELLIAVARRLHDCVRPSDTVARLGGDEFAIMLDRPDSQQEAIEVTERINRHLAERFSISGQNISVHASAGIATGDAGAGEPRGADPQRRPGHVPRQVREQAPLRAVRVRHGASGEETPPSQGAAEGRGQRRRVRRPLPADRRSSRPAESPPARRSCAGPTGRVAARRLRRSSRSRRRSERWCR